MEIEKPKCGIRFAQHGLRVVCFVENLIPVSDQEGQLKIF